jgi:hypothetical protein
MSLSWCYLDGNNILQSMCTHSAEVIGVGEFSSKLELKLQDIVKLPEPIMLSITQQNTTVLRTGKTLQSTTLFKNRMNDWTMVYDTKNRDHSGLLVCHYQLIPLNSLYHGWPTQLCREKHHLKLGDGNVLSAKDMTLLHRFLLGMPRKEMAACYFVTVKAIEKRLTRLREMLARDSHPEDSLHTSLNRLGLIPFLLAQPNWFEIRAYHTVHR